MAPPPPPRLALIDQICSALQRQAPDARPRYPSPKPLLHSELYNQALCARARADGSCMVHPPIASRSVCNRIDSTRSIDELGSLQHDNARTVLAVNGSRLTWRAASTEQFRSIILSLKRSHLTPFGLESLCRSTGIHLHCLLIVSLSPFPYLSIRTVFS